MRLVVAVVAVLGCGGKPPHAHPPLMIGSAQRGPDARVVFAKQVFAALAEGDVDELVHLADPIGLRHRVTECKHKSTLDIQQTYLRSARELYAPVASTSKGLTIEVVGIAQTASSDGDDDHADRILKKGMDVGDHCTIKLDLELQRLTVDIRAKRGAMPAIEQVVAIDAIDVDGHWFLVDIPQRIREKDGAVTLAKVSELRDRMCACKEHTCSDAVQKELTEFSRATDDDPNDPVVVRQIGDALAKYTECMAKIP